MRSCNNFVPKCGNWRGKVCSRDHALRVLVGPRLSGIARQRAMIHWLKNPTELWSAYSMKIRCRTQAAQQRSALLAKKTASAIASIAVLLSVQPTLYHVTFDPSMDEVELVIWSDSNEEPYFAIQSVNVEKSQTSVDIPRHSLPPGSYILMAQVRRWEGCPTRCESVVIDGSPTVIIKEREK